MEICEGILSPRRIILQRVATISVDFPVLKKPQVLGYLRKLLMGTFNLPAI
jgi:hypothetical protein